MAAPAENKNKIIRVNIKIIFTVFNKNKAGISDK